MCTSAQIRYSTMHNLDLFPRRFQNNYKVKVAMDSPSCALFQPASEAATFVGGRMVEFSDNSMSHALW